MELEIWKSFLQSRVLWWIDFSRQEEGTDYCFCGGAGNWTWGPHICQASTLLLSHISRPSDLVFILRSVCEHNKGGPVFKFWYCTGHLWPGGGSRSFVLLKWERLEKKKKKKLSAEKLKYDEVGTCEWQFPWLVPWVYFEDLSKLIWQNLPHNCNLAWPCCKSGRLVV